MSKKEGAAAEEKAEQSEAKAEHEAKKQKQGIAFFCCKNLLLTVIVVLIVGLIVGALIDRVAMPNTAGLAPSPAVGPDVNALQLKLQTYLTGLMQGQDANATVVSLTSLNSDLYSADILMESSGQKGNITVYVTKEGTTMFTGQEFSNIFFLDKSLPEPQPEAEPTPTFSYKDIEPQESALLEAFIVSNCPYGLQMQRILAPVATGLGANIKVRYIGSIEGGKITSMHGDVEAQENLRQICIREEQGGKYWPYVSEYMKKGDSEAALTAAGIDKAKLNTCMTDTSKGIAYAQADFDLANQNGVGSSPTLFLNGMQVDEFEFGADNNATGSERSAENVKNLLCYGFTTKPAACSTVLSKELASSGISEQYSGGTVSGGSC